jgi:hypothetical protein
MNNTFKLLKLPVLLGFIIGCGFVFSGCNRYGVPVTTHKKWVDWQIEFNPNTTEQEQQKVFYQLETYVLNYSDSAGITFNFINFKRIYRSPNIYYFQVDAGTPGKGQDATKSVPPKPKGPSQPLNTSFNASFLRAVRNINLIIR